MTERIDEMSVCELVDQIWDLFDAPYLGKEKYNELVALLAERDAKVRFEEARLWQNNRQAGRLDSWFVARIEELTGLAANVAKGHANG